jgi:amidohydrolase
VANELKDMGIEFKTINKTGIVGEIYGNKPGKCVLLRADMDALPIVEETGLEYASKNNNMHACGHDSHMATLLGTLKYFKSLNGEFEGILKFIFQPAEETIGGANTMIQQGILENPKVDCAFAIHNMSNKKFKEGEIVYKYGAGSGSVDDFYITIKGKGGHASRPHNTNDPIICASHFISNSQALISRQVNPTDIAVLSFTAINGGNVINVIPDNVEIKGTIRALDINTRNNLRAKLESCLKNTCEINNCSFNIK